MRSALVANVSAVDVAESAAGMCATQAAEQFFARAPADKQSNGAALLKMDTCGYTRVVEESIKVRVCFVHVCGVCACL